MRNPLRTSSLCLLGTLLCLFDSTRAASTQEWKSRSIYQIMIDRFALDNGSTTAPCNLYNYCGGTWKAVIDQLDYVQGMGFDAIYISPISEQISDATEEGESYHGYWPNDFNAVNSRFGTADDLKDLSQELHNRGMYLMMDVVINDMAYAIPNGSTEADVDYSSFAPPFNNASYFHPFCEISNYTNYTNAQWCWLGSDIVALPDLYTQEQAVVDYMVEWVKDAVANYSVDGLRIDAAKHVDNAFLQQFAAAADMYTVGEVYESDVSLFCPYQDLVTGMTNYPNYFAMIEAFAQGNISALANQMAITKKYCSDTTLLASFSENHDLPRFASYTQDLALAKTVIAWTILSDGVPMIYQGQEQHFSGGDTPENREALWRSGYDMDSELYKFTALMNKLRKHAISQDATYVDVVSSAIYEDDSTIVLRKGPEFKQIVAVLSNSGTNQTAYNLYVTTAYNPGLVATEITTCTNITLTEYGELIVPMGQGAPRIFFPSDQMSGSGICGWGESSMTTSTSNSTQTSTAKSGSTRLLSSLSMILGFFIACCVF